MGGPVIYHGASNGNGPWPGGGGGAPSASELSRFVCIPATMFQPFLGDGQDNPPWMTNSNLEVAGSPGAWFGRTMTFPPASTGGAWAQCSCYLPANLDISTGLLACSLAWWSPNPTPFNCNWHIHLTVENPGVIFAGGGPGAQVNQIPIANQMMYTPVLNVAPTRGGMAVPLVAGRLYHFNVYRGDAQIFNAELFGLIVTYSIVP